jgi:hypothetical protein
VNGVNHFHVNVRADPPGPLVVSWEQAATALHRLPRMIFEPDGSFVVAGDENGSRWQVDGHLYDFAGRLHRVELHGRCPLAVFDELLCCVGWPEQQLTFEMVREGVTVSEHEFRRCAEWKF